MNEGEVKRLGLRIDGVYIHDLFGSIPPKNLTELLTETKLLMHLQPNVQLHFISKETLKNQCPSLIHIGGIGQADYDKQVIHVCESDDGLSTTCSTLIHELLHLKDENHRCHRENDNFEEEVEDWEKIIYKHLVNKWK